jgi:hypothetical protein
VTVPGWEPFAAGSARLIVRWKTNYHLLDAAGIKQAAWKIARGKAGLAAGTRARCAWQLQGARPCPLLPADPSRLSRWAADPAGRATQRRQALLEASQRSAQHGGRRLERGAGLRAQLSGRVGIPQPDKRFGS